MTKETSDKAAEDDAVKHPENEPENEIVSATRALLAQKNAAAVTRDIAKNDDGKSSFGWKKAAGIGIGSAAVLAALLFANRDKR